MQHDILNLLNINTIPHKTKLYLDTSVISYLRQEDSPEKMSATNDFWDDIKSHDDVEIYISTITIKEIENCYEPKRTYLYAKLNEIKYKKLDVVPNTRKLATQIITRGILSSKSLDDCMHIACAILAECDYILSWNFKHLVNVKTIKGVKVISILEGFKTIDIITPQMFTNGEMDDDEDNT